MKKRVIKILTAVLTFALLLSCFTACQLDKNKQTNEENNELDNTNIFDSFQNDNNQDKNQVKTLSEISSTGQIPYDKFDYLGAPGLKMTDADLFPFKYSLKYGFADANGNVIIPEQYDDVQLFSEGKAFVKSNDSWKIIDINGNELFNIPTEFNKHLTISNFENGKAICSYSYNDASNKYIKVLIINSDLTTSQIEIPTNSGLKYKIINTPEFAGIITYNNYVEYDNSGTRNDYVAYRLYNLSGNKIWEIKTSYEALSPKVEQFEYNKALAPSYPLSVLYSIKVKNGYINIFDENFKWGLMNLSTGEMVLDFNYDYVGTYSDNLCNVCSYGKWGYVDLNGQQVLEFSYKYTEEFIDGKALVIMPDKSFKIIDKSGAICFDCGVGVNQPSYTQCRYQIYTNLQEKGIIIVRNHYGDGYYLINIGNSTKTIYDKSNPVIASQSNIFVGGTMFELV